MFLSSVKSGGKKKKSKPKGTPKQANTKKAKISLSPDKKPSEPICVEDQGTFDKFAYETSEQKAEKAKMIFEKKQEPEIVAEVAQVAQVEEMAAEPDTESENEVEDIVEEEDTQQYSLIEDSQEVPPSTSKDVCFICYVIESRNT